MYGVILLDRTLEHGRTLYKLLNALSNFAQLTE
jgi:hypothetical protein